MKTIHLLLLSIILIGCQSKPQGDAVPLPASSNQTSQPSPMNSASGTTKKDPPVQATDDEALVYHKTVKIRVKRDPKNGYSWELTGDNAKEIVAMDRELRKKLLSDEETASR